VASGTFTLCRNPASLDVGCPRQGARQRGRYDYKQYEK